MRPSMCSHVGLEGLPAALVKVLLFWNIIPY